MNFSGISGESIIGRCLRQPLRLIPKGALVPVLQGPLRGKKWIAGSSDHGCWLGSYEYGKQKMFAQAIRSGQVVYDLGANVGFYSLLASALVGPTGRVFAFEPDPANVRVLRRHLELNQISNCTVIESAISNSAGYADFAFGDSRSTGRLDQRSSDGLRVRTVALDELLRSGELPAPDIMKCDIEGGEHRALLGACEILTQHTPTIFLATHGLQQHELCCRLLGELDYKLVPMDALKIEWASEVLAVPQKARVGPNVEKPCLARA
jgi:FkbM family methyltransferase